MGSFFSNWHSEPLSAKTHTISRTETFNYIAEKEIYVFLGKENDRLSQRKLSKNALKSWTTYSLPDNMKLCNKKAKPHK